ncbi:prefoldin subunit beta [Candidatus Woesearchaeota archaeon]|nr:prefoldin subunit beta [Candidatus Woesearchaeota archaeon]
MREENTQQKISNLQLLEQNTNNLSLQKQQFQSQLFETESALKELKKTADSYKIIGNIMVKTKPEELRKELEEKKQVFDLRIKSFEKQEKEISEKASKLQAEVLKELKEQNKK